ncbi:MAG TPA: sulfite exporter TauE/SafE family protein [Bacteroidota bacterium]|nr:sulfite exporter TauE/SafE family protein [Bacteroidota bacterium]
MIEYGVVFLTGLLAGFHCVGMCGAVVLACSLQGTAAAAGQSLWRRTAADVLRHGAYNGGRVASYAVLGALVSAAGLRLAWLRSAADGVSLIAGAVMVVAALAMLGVIPLPSRIAVAGGGLTTRLQARLLKGSSPARTLALGLLTPLLPCGLLYGMLAKAAAAETIGAGALMMGVFALGTTPSLGALGGVSSFVTAATRRRAERLAALAIMLMGIVLLLRGLHVPFLGIVEPQGSSCCAPPA